MRHPPYGAASAPASKYGSGLKPGGGMAGKTYGGQRTHVTTKPLPASGCLHCGGKHWLANCGTVSPSEKEAALRRFRERPKGEYAVIGLEDSESVLTSTASVIDSAEGDGLLSIGALNMPCLLDTGATYSLLSMEKAITASKTGEAVLSELDAPFNIKTMTQGAAGIHKVTHVLTGDAALHLYGGGTLGLQSLRIYVASGITSTVLLLSRKVMQEQLGIDVRAQACSRVRVLSSSGTSGHVVERSKDENGNVLFEL